MYIMSKVNLEVLTYDCLHCKISFFLFFLGFLQEGKAEISKIIACFGSKTLEWFYVLKVQDKVVEKPKHLLSLSDLGEKVLGK